MTRTSIRFPVVTVVALLLVAVALLVRVSRAEHGAPMTIVGSPVATPGAATPAPLGLPPMDCGGPAPRVIAPYFGPAVGGKPIWVIGFEGPHATLSVSQGRSPALANVTHTAHGWTVRVLWVIEPGQTAPVTLAGRARLGGEPLWFQIGQDEPATTPRLDPSQPGIPVQHGEWKEFPSYLFVPAAGCYELQAHWAGGSWRIVFAAGA